MPLPQRQKPWDGHELGFYTTLAGCTACVNAALPKGWWRGFIHRAPSPAMSVALVGFGWGLALVLPPIRRAVGLPTNQFNAEHPLAVHPKKYDNGF